MKHFFLFGKAGTGKDTLAELLEERFGIYSLALADPIRGEYRRYFQKADYKQNREKMIEIGEKYKEIFGDDVWCREALRKCRQVEYFYERIGHDLPGILIRDGRYQVEYDFFVKHGFAPVRLVSDMQVRIERLINRDGSAQLSSLAFEDSNFVSDTAYAIEIANNGTIDELSYTAARLLGLVETEN